MKPAARAWVIAGLSLAALVPAPVARAAGDAIDDPKLARRLGARVTVPAASAAPSNAAPVATSTPPPVPSPPPVVPLASDAGGVSGSGATVSGAPAADLAATSAPAGAAPAGNAGGRTPRLGLGFRRFSFVQVGAVAPTTPSGTASSEPFNSLSLDFYPISSSVRFGLSTQYGWQSGSFNSGSGDYFIAQSASLGGQIPGAVVTPFAEVFAGGGYLRRFQFDRTIPTAYWQFGLDAGANIFVADHGYFSVALGYLRPVNGFLKMQSFTSVYVDTWSLKIGVGL